MWPLLKSFRKILTTFPEHSTALSPSCRKVLVWVEFVTVPSCITQNHIYITIYWINQNFLKVLVSCRGYRKICLMPQGFNRNHVIIATCTKLFMMQYPFSKTYAYARPNANRMTTSKLLFLPYQSSAQLNLNKSRSNNATTCPSFKVKITFYWLSRFPAHTSIFFRDKQLFDLFTLLFY